MTRSILVITTAVATATTTNEHQEGERMSLAALPRSSGSKQRHKTS